MLRVHAQTAVGMSLTVESGRQLCALHLGTRFLKRTRSELET